MIYNRFDHEQQIMKCWNIVDELSSLNKAIMETDITRDKISNVLMGLADLYEIKFNELWDQFEASIKDQYAKTSGEQNTDA